MINVDGNDMESTNDNQEIVEIEAIADSNVELVELVDSAENDIEAIEASENNPVVEAEVENDSESKAKVKKVKTPTTPAYASFIAAVEAHARSLGLNVKEQTSYFQFVATTGHKIYVEKSLKKGVTRVDTSLPRTALIVNGRDISLPLSKSNGRISCHIDPSVESVKQALEVLASYGDKIPAPKKAVKSQQTEA